MAGAIVFQHPPYALIAEGKKDAGTCPVCRAARLQGQLQHATDHHPKPARGSAARSAVRPTVTL